MSRWTCGRISNWKTLLLFLLLLLSLLLLSIPFSLSLSRSFLSQLEDGNIFLVTFFLEVCSDYFSQVASCYRVCLSSDRGFDFLLMKNWTIARSFVGSYTPIIKLILWINWLLEGILKNDHYLSSFKQCELIMNFKLWFFLPLTKHIVWDLVDDLYEAGLIGMLWYWQQQENYRLGVLYWLTKFIRCYLTE